MEKKTHVVRIEMDEQTFRNFRAECIRKGITVADGVTQAITRDVERLEKANKKMVQSKG